jgi:death-on-curing protein
VKEPVWLPLEAVVDYQRILIEIHGGAPGLRDRGMLESALARPRNKVAYGGSLFEAAAAYCYGLCNDHCFVDGNKRIGFAAMAAFLEMNGWILDAREEEAYRVTMEVASGGMKEEALASWIERNAVSPESD